MADKLYDLMDWARIEGVVYSEEDAPREILGPQVTKEGILIQCFFPGAQSVRVETLSGKKAYPMTLEDEEGFYAVLIPGKKIPEYQFVITREDKEQICRDAYAYPNMITEEQEAQFAAGICYDIYEKLGAHPQTVQGVDGTYFAVWAPNALRVSVVGDFNDWDGRVYQMNRLTMGIFELFIPGVKTDMIYKYEIKTHSGLTFLKADPYANYAQLRPENASIVADLSSYKWSDNSWMKTRKKEDMHKKPMYVYELHLGTWKKQQDVLKYTELAPLVRDYVKTMGYTHVELMPVMEHPSDESMGYQTTGYFAPTSRFGTPEDFMAFVDVLHQAGIGVILDWVPSQFAKDEFALASFDGTCLYEYEDPKKGIHPQWGTLIFNYGSPYVKNFLIASAFFWADKYHVDGLRLNGIASMLYLDYNRKDGEWAPNIYGSNENLEGQEFLKHLNSVFKKQYPDVLLIAEEATAWPMVTGAVEEDGLGFDFKWNTGWVHDFMEYMSLDPIFRGAHHDELTLSMVYAYSENFILALSHDELFLGHADFMERMPGDESAKAANMRALLGFQTAHPGKKLLVMGQDRQDVYMKDLLKLYHSYPALYTLDENPDGFEWINNMEAEKNIVTFLRKTKKKEELLLVVCNFSALTYENYEIGVPYNGKYKEIFNSDAVVYGGEGNVNPRVKMTRKIECDERPYSIKVKVPPLGISVYSFTKVVEALTDNKTAKSKKKTVPVKKMDLKKELEEKINKEEKISKAEKPAKKK